MNSMGLVIVLLTGSVLVTCWVFRKVTRSSTHLPVTAHWIEELSPERYRPMMRLLEPDDVEFLRSQPGFTWRMASRLRAQRSQIFRSYLSSLDQDFRRVSMALKLILLHSSHDRPDLAGALVREQARFALGMAGVRLRLFLYRWDLCRVDVSGVVRIFDSMRLELQRLVPASADLIA
jgi:hypothetical protein